MSELYFLALAIQQSIAPPSLSSTNYRLQTKYPKKNLQKDIKKNHKNIVNKIKQSKQNHQLFQPR